MSCLLACLLAGWGLCGALLLLLFVAFIWFLFFVFVVYVSYTSMLYRTNESLDAMGLCRGFFWGGGGGGGF